MMPGALSVHPIESPPIPLLDADTAAVAWRSGRPEPWELPALRELGARLEAARLAADLPLLALGVAIGLSPSAIRGIELGRVRTRPARIREWAGATSIDAEQLLAEFGQVVARDPERPVQRWQPRPDPAPCTWDAAGRRLRQLEPPPPVAPGRRASLGFTLWRWRVELSFTRAELADRIGCHHRSLIWRIEQGQRRPSRELLERVATGLGKPDLAAFLLDLEPSAIAPLPRSIHAGEHLRKTSPASQARPNQPNHAPTTVCRPRKEP